MRVRWENRGWGFGDGFIRRSVEQGGASGGEREGGSGGERALHLGVLFWFVLGIKKKVKKKTL